MILVIKLSGKVIEDASSRRSLCEQMAQLVGQGHRFVVVHGGGKQLTELSRRLEVPIVQHQGRRVTDEATLELATMVFSATNRRLVSSLLASGVKAIGISAFDGGLVCCRKRPPIPVAVSPATGAAATVRPIDFGLVGEIETTDVSLLSGFWEAGLFPVVSCLGADARGQILNINADTLAAELSVALRATRLISVSDLDGIYKDLSDTSTLIPSMSSSEARQYLIEGRFSDGMVPKIESALGVLERGVGAVQVLSGLKENTLLEGVAGEAGTLIHD